jgi:hypothetical protein
MGTGVISVERADVNAPTALERDELTANRVVELRRELALRGVNAYDAGDVQGTHIVPDRSSRHRHVLQPREL